MEQVLVCNRAELDKLGSFQGISTDPKYAALLENTFFMDRKSAEEDPNFKQLIPYILIKNTDGLYFRYQRTKKVGEQRLASRYSLACGGHINPVDGVGKNAYQKGLLREIDEEIEFLNKNWYNSQIPSNEWYNITRVGFLNDDSNKVGEVHLGIVEVLTLIPGVSAKLNEEALTDGRFDILGNISKLNLENWSKILVEYLMNKSFETYYKTRDALE